MLETAKDDAGTCYSLGGTGNEPPVVLVHGVGLDMAMWENQRAALSGKARVLCYDLLGHGQSINPPGARTLPDFIDQLSRLLAHLELHSIRLVGFSLGALIAQGFAARFPDKIARLVILHSVFQRSEQAREVVRARCDAVAEHGPLVNLDEALERWFSPSFLKQYPEQAEKIRAVFEAHRDDGYLKAYRVFAEADEDIPPAELARTDCPTLVVTGEMDPGSTSGMTRNLAERIPGARSYVLPGARHLSPIEHAPALNEILIEFLM